MQFSQTFQYIIHPNMGNARPNDIIMIEIAPNVFAIKGTEIIKENVSTVSDTQTIITTVSTVSAIN